ncbi:hypothetical protein [Niallia endozanthoxylica]|uniref:hypothetical protein n=1 Tax=Niallia endozanthoxylica TaxID=2036016 RepID=UPI00168B5BFA|nr:hypothetical protein [Niallia endozanthoxylica]
MERKVYLVLTDTGTFFTRMIKFYTKQPFNHASLSFDPHLSELYSFGRKRPRNPFSGGFVRESIHKGLLKRAKCAIYCCTITESQYLKMNQFIRLIESQKDLYRYNLLGLFAIALNKEINREYRFFCSQFVSTVLKEAHVIELPKHPSHVTPHDLQQIPLFHLVYQGDFEDYKHAADIADSKDLSINRTDLIRLLRKKFRIPTLPL